MNEVPVPFFGFAVGLVIYFAIQVAAVIVGLFVWDRMRGRRAR